MVREPTASDHVITSLPILMLFPHNRCNCRCVMCDIWRIRQERELTPHDLQPHMESIRRLGVRWVVLSGGEPQLNSDLWALSRLLRFEGIRVTLLTAGLLLEAEADLVAAGVDDVIVSLDGPPEIHDRVRRVPEAFDRLKRGIARLRECRPEIAVRGRCTVQKANYLHLRETVVTAKSLRLESLSFLAADLTSEAFNRPGGWTAQRQSCVALAPEETDELEREIEALISAHAPDLAAGFVAESPDKLRRICRHFRAHLGQAPAVAPSCNAPWVSTVVEADGTVRPCFFHRSIGNVHEQPLAAILNSEDAVDFRRRLDVSSDPVCRNCVCSLRLEPEEINL